MRRRNNFDFLRVLAALAVLTSHVRPLHDATFPLGALGALGVFTFFAMSGYLVSASWDRDPNVSRFVIRRALRIFPGLITAVLVAAFVVGPLVSALPVNEYFSNSMVYHYCRAVLLYPMQYTLPGVFNDNPLKDNVNGSLWTLPMEVSLYVALTAISAVIAYFRWSILPILFVSLALMYGIELRAYDGDFLSMRIQELSRCASCFVWGSILWHLRATVRFPHWTWAPMVMFGLFARATPLEIWMLLLFVPAASIAFATASYPVIRDAGRFGDCSYGLYVYAFLIQQTLIHYFPHISAGHFYWLSALISAISGFASWHLIESPLLNFKNKLATSSAASKSIGVEQRARRDQDTDGSLIQQQRVQRPRLGRKARS